MEKAHSAGNNWSAIIEGYYHTQIAEGELPFISDTDLFMMPADGKHLLLERGFMLTSFNEGVLIHPVPVDESSQEQETI